MNWLSMYVEKKKMQVLYCVSPEVPESWLSKHSPGYIESRFCEKGTNVLVSGSAFKISIRLTRLPKLRVEAFTTDKQIQTAFQ